MKLLVFSPYYPPHMGGLESHADEFNRHLSQRGMDITVFTPRIPKNAPDFEIIHNNVKVYRFPSFEIISNYPVPKFWSAVFWKLYRKLFEENYDIVISRTRFFLTSLLALIYAKVKKVRWIHIEHGSDFVKSGGTFSVIIARLYDYTFGKLILVSAEKIIANSKASAEFCRKISPRINCEIIYRGVEIKNIKFVEPDVKIKERYPNDCIITFMGRLIDGKGVADLLNAAKNIKENFKIFIVGDGPQAEALKRLAKKSDMEKKIVFFGHQTFENTIGILKISDILVNPSYTEGLPTTVIEAALCKKAIIATNVGGTPEIISENNDGFIIEPKNVALLKEKLEILIKDKKIRVEFGNNAFEKVKDKFDWNKSIEQYLKIFKNF